MRWSPFSAEWQFIAAIDVIGALLERNDKQTVCLVVWMQLFAFVLPVCMTRRLWIAEFRPTHIQRTPIPMLWQWLGCIVLIAELKGVWVAWLLGDKSVTYPGDH